MLRKEEINQELHPYGISLERHPVEIMADKIDPGNIILGKTGREGGARQMFHLEKTPDFDRKV